MIYCNYFENHNDFKLSIFLTEIQTQHICPLESIPTPFEKKTTEKEQNFLHFCQKDSCFAKTFSWNASYKLPSNQDSLVY